MDDCSRDQTAAIVASHAGVVLRRMERNGGKGRAVRAGIEEAISRSAVHSGRCTVIQAEEENPIMYVRLAWLVAIAALLAACESAPVTGRKQLMLVPESQAISASKEAYTQTE